MPFRKPCRRSHGDSTSSGIPYCVAGGMALFQHGYRRFTEDVDILVTREGLREIHAGLDGLGYLPPVHSKQEPARYRERRSRSNS